MASPENSMQQHDIAVSSVANKAMYAGGVSAAFGGFTASEITAFVGAAIALLGFFVQLFFKIRADRRDAELHKRRLESLDSWGND